MKYKEPDGRSASWQEGEYLYPDEGERNETDVAADTYSVFHTLNTLNTPNTTTNKRQTLIFSLSETKKDGKRKRKKKEKKKKKKHQNFPSGILDLLSLSLSHTHSVREVCSDLQAVFKLH